MAAMAWVATLGVTQAGEGITFGILCGVTAVRLPKTLPLYAPLARTPLFWLFAGFMAWKTASGAWGPAADGGPLAALQRFSLAPALLWPLCHRAGILAATFTAAGILNAAAIIALNVGPEGIARYKQAKTLGKELGLTSACLAAAILIAITATWASGAGARVARACGIACMSGALAVFSQRTSVVALAAGMAAAGARAIAGIRARSTNLRGAAWTAAACTGALLLVTATMPRFHRLIAGTTRQMQADSVGVEQLNAVTSNRGSLALVAIQMLRERPLAGFGHQSFGPEARRRVSEDPASFGVTPQSRRAVALATTSHNAFLDEAAMRGAVGLGLLSALLVALAVTSWRDPSGPTCLALLASWCVYALTDAATERGTHLALLTVIVARCCMVSAARREAG